MRERTAFPRELLERLPDLELLVTTGMRNASVDIEYLRSAACASAAPASPDTAADGSAPGLPSTIEVAWALIFALFKRVTLRGPRDARGASGRRDCRATSPARRSACSASAGSGAQMVAPGEGVRHGRDRLEPEPHARARRRGRRACRSTKDELLGPQRRALDPPGAERAHARPDRRRGARPDEAERVPGQHLARADRRRAGAASTRCARGGSPAPASTSTTSSRCRPTASCSALQNTVLTPHLGYVSREGLAEMYEQVVEDIAASPARGADPRDRVAATLRAAPAGVRQHAHSFG